MKPVEYILGSSDISQLLILLSSYKFLLTFQAIFRALISADILSTKTANMLCRECFCCNVWFLDMRVDTKKEIYGDFN